jgi:isopropylmalate/homocitrate/citramalate synthase
MKTIYIIDVTNRDGAQTSRICIAKLQKTIINTYLNKMGVVQSEFGFPLTRHEKHYLEGNLELARMGILSPIILSGWIRATVEDVKKAFQIKGLKHVNLSTPTSDQMLAGKFGGRFSRQAIIKNAADAVRKAVDGGMDSVGINAEDASRTDLSYLIEFAAACKEAGAARFRYCDTLGYDAPNTIYERMRRLARATGMPMEVHCHNDLGMAVANSVMGAKGAVDGGVDAYVNTTINGIGERAGNAALVPTLLALKKACGISGKYNIDKRLDLAMSWKITKYGAYAFSVPIPVNQPGVGANVFSHESGIHADGALKDRRNYELYDHEELGRGEPETIETGRQITVGDYSGIKGFRNVYNRMEIKFKNDREAAKILDLVRFANVHTQQALVEEELRFIAAYPDIARQIMRMAP